MSTILSTVGNSIFNVSDPDVDYIFIQQVSYEPDLFRFIKIVDGNVHSIEYKRVDGRLTKYLLDWGISEKDLVSDFIGGGNIRFEDATLLKVLRS